MAHKFETFYIQWTDHNHEARNGYTSDRHEIRISPLAKSFKMKHPLTKEVKIFENKFVMYNDHPSHPYIIEKFLQRNETLCKKYGFDICVNERIPHPNLSGNNYGILYATPKSRTPIATIITRSFCNPIMQRSLYRNLDENLLFLSLQLEKFTFSDAYNQDLKRYADWECTENIAGCQSCGKPFNIKSTPVELASGYCAGCLQIHRERAIPELMGNVDRIGTEGYMIKFKDRGGYVPHSVETYNKYKDSENISKHYPVFDFKTLRDNLGSVPRNDMDICVMGLGSAGSGLLDQIGRTNMLSKYTLIDFDVIEEKNFRNQLYTRGMRSNYKSESMRGILQNFKQNPNDVTVQAHNRKFQDVGSLKYTDFKYMMLGFDSIEARLEALNEVIASNYSSKYILDTRFEGLNASVYFVDTSNEAEMKYYKDCLEADGEAFAKMEAEKMKDWKLPPYSMEDSEVKSYLKGIIERGGCSTFTREVCKLGDQIYNFCDVNRDNESPTNFPRTEAGHCRSGDCTTHILKYVNDKNIILPLPSNKQQENTCIQWNVIDIYKYASTYLTAAIREIEEGKSKPFTHVECMTGGFPQAMIMRK